MSMVAETFSYDRNRERLRRWAVAVVSVALALALGFFGLSFLFADFGPGETTTSRIISAALFFVVVALPIGYLNERRWWLAGLVGWGSAIAGLFPLAGGLALGNWRQALQSLIFFGPLLLALGSGYGGAVIRRRKAQLFGSWLNVLGALALILLVAALWFLLHNGRGSGGIFRSMMQPALSDAALVPLTVGTATVAVEVADSPETRSRGLSHRPRLAQDRGILFIFDGPTRPAFWMRAMQFPIDIIWINEAGTVTEITAAVSPDTYPQRFTPQLPIRYVLEVNAGWAERHGVVPGITVMSALIDRAGAHGR
ncbi:MAG: DUF192 domain-containing protein [Patescibacteria group bacterium]|nr:DUF192 domain-containing protein [Patescibacteria group bacterium]